MAPHKVDPVKVLFDGLPIISLYLVDGFENPRTDGHLRSSLTHFVAQCDKIKAAGQEFVDPDTAFLHENFALVLKHPFRETFGMTAFLMPILGELALQHQQILRNGSNKHHYLRLALWIVRGRRDNESPFDPEAHQPSGAVPFQTDHFANLNVQTAKHDDTDNDHLVCAHCEATDGKLQHCGGCLLDETWGFLAVSYCSKACQVAHWKAHKSVCKQRKSLIVAVTQLRALTQLFQSRTCDQTYEILDATRGQYGTIRLRQFGESHHPPGGAKMAYEAFKGDFLFRPLARGFVGPDASDSVDFDNAIIHYNRCGEHTGVAWPLVQRFLKPLCTSITEVYLIPKNIAIVITEQYGPGVANAATFYKHQVLHVELPSSEKFIIDLSGAQYGWHETLSRPSDFMATRCAKIVRTDLPGATAGEGDFFRILNPPDLIETMAHRLKQEVISVINNRVQVQQFETKCRAGDGGEAPLTRSATATLVGQDLPRMLRVAESAMDECFDRYKALGMYRLCLTRKGYVRVTMTPEEGRIYRYIWLTEEEWDPIKDNEEALLMRWHTKVGLSRRLRGMKA